MDIFQKNQSDNLKSCLLCYPANFKIIYKSSPYYNKINYDLLYSQYNNFINTLSQNNITLNFIDINKNSYNQVFTQDIGFVIRDIFFISIMRKKEREIEPDYLKKFINNNNFKYYEMKNHIEGGDVMPYGNIVFVGISTRTTLNAVKELQKVLNDNNINMTVVPINFDNSMIHLDCVFNTLDYDCAVISPYVYDKALINKYINNLYDIDKHDADKLGTNYVYLGEKKIITANKNISVLLKNKGYETYYIDYSEIEKAEGSLACSCMYLKREN